MDTAGHDGQYDGHIFVSGSFYLVLVVRFDSLLLFLSSRTLMRARQLNTGTPYWNGRSLGVGEIDEQQSS